MEVRRSEAGADWILGGVKMGRNVAGRSGVWAETERRQETDRTFS